MLLGVSVRNGHVSVSAGFARLADRSPARIRPPLLASHGGAKFPSSEASASDTAKSDFPAELEVPDWRSRTCPSQGIQNKRDTKKKSEYAPRFTRPAPIGGAGW